MNTKPVLYNYFDKKAEELLSKYNLSLEQKSSRNKGDNREIFINNFLSKVLPPKLSVRSGEVWDNKGFKTGQLDTVIIRDDCPSLDFGGKDVYLSEGLFAVVEIKSNLTSTKLEESAKTLEQVSKLQPLSPSIIAGGSTINRPLRIVFSYDGLNWDTLINKVEKNQWWDLFDLICILKKGVLIKKSDLLFTYDLDTGKQNQNNFVVYSSPPALGFLYYYLVQYGQTFLAGVLQLEEYFNPLSQWGEIGVIKKKNL